VEAHLIKDLLEEHDKHLKVQDDLVMEALALQEGSLLLSITYKEVRASEHWIELNSSKKCKGRKVSKTTT
jgi:hypothetical protein